MLLIMIASPFDLSFTDDSSASVYAPQQPPGARASRSALGTGSREQNVMARQFKAMGVLDLLLQVGDVFHVHIKDTAAFFTFDVIVRMAPALKPVRSAGDLDPADLPHLGQAVQIPVHRRPADVGVVFDDGVVDLIGSHMSRKLLDGLLYQRALDRVSFYHNNQILSFLIDIIYQ